MSSGVHVGVQSIAIAPVDPWAFKPTDKNQRANWLPAYPGGYYLNRRLDARLPRQSAPRSRARRLAQTSNRADVRFRPSTGPTVPLLNAVARRRYR